MGRVFFINSENSWSPRNRPKWGGLNLKIRGFPFQAGSTLEETMSSILTRDTPLKLNMEPENDGFQKESPFPGVDFQVPC